MTFRPTAGVKIAILAPQWGKYDGLHRRLLEKSGMVATVTDHQLTKPEMLHLFGNNNFETAIIGDEVLDLDVCQVAKENGLLCMSRHGTGVNPTMLAAAKQLNIPLARTPGTTVTPVSELAVSLIGASYRGVCDRNNELATGGWNKVAGEELRGKKALMFGSGMIGLEIARLLLQFGVDVTACSRTLSTDTEALWEEVKRLKGDGFKILGGRCGGFRWVPTSEKDGALAEADMTVLICPQTDQTADMVDEAFLGKMKRGSMLVSMSRGGLIKNEMDIVHALHTGQLGRFVADVYRQEPINSKDDCPFLGMPGVLTTPHIGWLTIDNLGRQLGAAFANCLVGISGDRSLGSEYMDWVVPLE